MCTFSDIATHMLWLLIRSASNEYPQHMFSWRNKKNMKAFSWKRETLSGAIIEALEKRDVKIFPL